MVPADNTWGVRAYEFSEGFCNGLPHWGCSSAACSLAAPYLPMQTCALTSCETKPCAWAVDKGLAR